MKKSYMLKLAFALVTVAFITACGGGEVASAAQPLKIYAQPSDRTIPTVGYDAQMRIKTSGQPLPDVVTDVAQQAAMGSAVILTVGGKTQWHLDRLPVLLAEAKKYPNFEWVYVYDELCLRMPLDAPCEEKAAVIQAAQLIRAAGFKVLATYFPDTVMHPGFDASILPYLDGIALDVYPSIRISNELYGCSYGNNILENVLRCNVAKLRALGFNGMTGYIWQAFARHAEPLEVSIAHANLQRPVIDAAMRGEYDVQAVMPWGLYIGAIEQQLESDINPLGGTPYEYLVTP